MRSKLLSPKIAIPAVASLIIAISAIAYVAFDTSQNAQEANPTSVPAVPPMPNPVATKPPATSSDLILDLFQPSDDALQQQHSTHDITSQIENAMVISYTLVHCKLMSQQEYSEMFNALITFAERTHLEPDTAHAEARVRQIASAAAASYTMVYSTTPCTDPELPAQANALKTWREWVRKPPAPAQ